MSQLTPQVAQDLMWRSMTTGAPTSEFDRYGGYSAVKAMYDQGGGQYDTNVIPQAQRQQYAETIANTGVGNLSLLKEMNVPLTAAGREAMTNNGVTSWDAGALTNAGIPFQQTTGEQLSGLGSSFSALQKQMADLQAKYDALSAKKSGGGVVNTGGTVGGGGVVDDGSSMTGPGGMGNSGVVYGPDGKSYSSAAAAVAAGVTNWSYVKPMTPQQQAPGLVQGANKFNYSMPMAATGNTNPANLTPDTASQLRSFGPPKVNLPTPQI
jgi:hypothetical protein